LLRLLKPRDKKSCKCLKKSVDTWDNKWYHVIMKLDNVNIVIVGKYVQAFLDIDTYDTARSRALRDGVTLSDFISSAIKEYLKKGGVVQAENNPETSII